MARLSPDLFARYKANPLAVDAEVRQFCNLPSNRYYTVSIWPDGGIVQASNLSRTPPVNKISKSSQ